MRTLLALGLFFLAIANQASASIVQLGDFEGHHYYISEDAMTVYEGRTLAEATGVASNGTGYLVAMTSHDEQQWLNGALQALGLSNRLSWIGLSDEVEEGVWRWDSGEPVTFTNWCIGEPNDWEGEEDHAHMNWSEPGVWNDIAGWRRYHALIEVEFGGGVSPEPIHNTVPEPASAAVIAMGLIGVSRRLKSRKTG